MSRPDLNNLLAKEHNPFVHSQRYDALVSVIPNGVSYKTCQRLWLFDVTIMPARRNGNITVGAKFAMFKFGLPETGLRLAVPQQNEAMLKAIISIAVPVQMLSIVNDGTADWYTTYNGRFTDKLTDIADLLEKRLDPLPSS